MPELSLDDDRALRTLLARYCHAIDEGRIDDLLGLFADDAVLTIMGKTHEGHAGLREWAPTTGGKHVTVNLDLRADGDGASGRLDWLFLWPGEGGSVGIMASGQYHDRYVRVGDAWKIQRRDIRLLGEGPA